MACNNTTRQLPSQLAGSPLGQIIESPLFSTALNRVMLQGFSALLGMLAVQLVALARRSQLAFNFSQEFRMMNRSLVAAALALALVFTATGFAQQPPADQAGGRWSRGQHRDGGRDISPDAQLERLNRRLKLSDDQKAKIKPILEKQAQQMQDMRQHSSTAPQDRRARFQQIHQDTMAQIRPLLTGDQQKKLDEMQEKMKQRREHRGEHRGPGGPPTGAPPSQPDQE